MKYIEPIEEKFALLPRIHEVEEIIETLKNIIASKVLVDVTIDNIKN